MKVLKITLFSLLALLLFAFQTKAAHAWIGSDLWQNVSCVADIDCTVRAASTAGANFISKVAVDKDFEEISDDDVAAMINGKWDRGLASAVGQVGGLAYSYPPIHLKEYIRTALANNLLNNQVQAQTPGTDALLPVQAIWTRMRDVAYGLFVIVMIAIGIMIILQHSISPRVIVTFTNSLPRIILGLVLITFSFPLIALFIDVGAVFGTQLILRITQGIFPELVSRFSGGIADTFSAAPGSLIGHFAAGLTGLQILSLPALILFVIFAIAAIVLAGLTIFRLIISYAWLIVYTVFSPILLLFGSLPGQEENISNFFKNVAAKTLSFPVIFFLVLLGVGFAGTAYVGTAENFLRGNFGELVTGVFSTQGLLGAILGLIMLAAAFKAPAMIEEVIGVGGKKPKKK